MTNLRQKQLLQKGILIDRCIDTIGSVEIRVREKEPGLPPRFCRHNTMAIISGELGEKMVDDLTMLVAEYLDGKV